MTRLRAKHLSGRRYRVTGEQLDCIVDLATGTHDHPTAIPAELERRLLRVARYEDDLVNDTTGT